ncbi:MAG: DUF1778 domain-containing protein [Vulcanimicrobiaceae bacterium]|jgi:uncharacterized protein (DUF1778 family)
MATPARKAKTSNITFRLTLDQKALLETGMVLAGASDLTTFVLTPALERARELTQHESTTTLTDASRRRFIELMEHPPEPSEKLMRALRDKRHKIVLQSLELRLEALSRNHDRAAFSCGHSAIDNLLQYIAMQRQERGVASAMVAIDATGNPQRIVGYYCVLPHDSVEPNCPIPGENQRKLAASRPFQVCSSLNSA